MAASTIRPTVAPMHTRNHFYPALYRQGLTAEAAAALESDDELAAKTVSFIAQSIAGNLAEDEAAIRRETLGMVIHEERLLGARVSNALRRRGIVTVGDLAIRTKRQVGKIPNISTVALEQIDALFESLDGIDRPPQEGRVLEHSRKLYGEARYIPARTLIVWRTTLEKQTKDYLCQLSTLEQLAGLPAIEVVKMLEYNGLARYLADNDIAHLRIALKKLGLSFSGE